MKLTKEFLLQAEEIWGTVFFYHEAHEAHKGVNLKWLTRTTVVLKLSSPRNFLCEQKKFGVGYFFYHEAHEAHKGVNLKWLTRTTVVLK